MKSIEFEEGQLGDLQAIADRLFGEETDPRSAAYRRVLERPRISWLRIMLNCLVPVICGAAAAWMMMALGFRIPAAVAVTMAGLLGYVLIHAKQITICCVRIYQRYAPESLRKKCRFEPSCSQYMILSLEKYGLWKGLTMGIDRLKRCNIHNGGFDFP